MFIHGTTCMGWGGANAGQSFALIDSRFCVCPGNFQQALVLLLRYEQKEHFNTLVISRDVHHVVALSVAISNMLFFRYEQKNI